MKRDLLKFFKNISIVVIVILLLFSPVFYFNFIVDPYGIFRSDFTKQRIEPNSHFIKLRYILYNPNKFDSFIFGNSRANNIDNTKIPAGHFFNLYYSIGFPKEHLQDIKMMLNQKVHIKNILICLDFATYSGSDWNREDDPLRVPYPNSKWSLFKFYLNYIFQIPQYEFLKKVLSTSQNNIYKNILVTGRAVNTEAEKFIEANKQKHANDNNFKYPSVIGTENHVDETILVLTEIINLCKANKIQLKMAMNPVYKISYLGNNLNLHFDFIKKLSGITDFYDFGSINKVTANNYFYYETAHFRPIIGDAMVNFIYRNKTIDTIPDFGILVTKINIDNHILKLKSQLNK